MTDAAEICTDLAPHQTDPVCRKCRSKEVRVVWHPMPVAPYPCRLWLPPCPEHLCMRCHRCGHEWASWTADAEEVPDADPEPEV